MNRLIALCLTLIAAAAAAQQPQTQTAPIYPVNAKYVQGVAPGYWPTPGAGLTLNLTAGTSFCNGLIYPYVGGTLTMTASTTNYVYLDPSSSCVPAVNTTGFTSSLVPIAVVVTGSSAITTITDDRTILKYTPSSSGGVTSCSAGQVAYYNSSGTTLACLNVGSGVVISSGSLTTVGQQPAQVAASFVGVPANSQIIALIPVDFALTIPSSCSGSYMGATVAATSSAAFTVKKLAGGPTGSATTLCTATFSASGTAASFSGSGGSLAAGDYLEIVGPATADATLANLGVGIYGTR